GGLVATPVPASLVGEGRASWRALTIVPFVVLAAAAGLHVVWTAETDRRRRAVFTAAIGITVLLASFSHGHISHAQAFFRAALIPAIVAALALGPLTIRRADAFRVGVQWLAMLAVAQTALAFVSYTTLYALLTAAGIAAAVVFLAPARWLSQWTSASAAG